MSEIEEQIAEEMGDDAPDVSPDADGDGEESAAGAADSPGDEAAPAPRSQSDIEAIQKKLEAEAARHDKRVREIMGDDYQLLVPSPVDWTPGYIFNVEGMRPFPEQLDALDALVGRGGGADLLPADDAEPCEKCNALGEVLTGSRKDGQRTKTCRHCTGAGWVTKTAPLAPVQPLPQVYGDGGATAANQPNVMQVADRWGRPVGHPHYGLEPAYVGA